MKHLGTKTLETERLILRKFTIADAEAMYRNWAGDDEVTKYLTWPTHQDDKGSEYVIGLWLREYDKPSFYQWAICFKDNNEPFGSISIVNEVNDEVGLFEVGYCIGKAYWNQGFTSEALKAVIDFLFDEVGANKVQARHDPLNPNSGKVMLKCGMKYEGTLRQCDQNNMGICDCAYYGILKSEH